MIEKEWLTVGELFHFPYDDKESQKRVVVDIEIINGNEIVHSMPEFTPVANTTMHFNGKIKCIVYEKE